MTISLDDGWFRESLRNAYEVALDSPDPSTQNGAIVFNREFEEIGRGCNTFTYGMPITEDLFERPKKYAYIEHAERNALFDVLSQGNSLPHIMVCPWAACADCARAIIQSGIKVLVRHEASDSSWTSSIEDGDIMMRAAGVQLITVKGSLGGCWPLLRNGEVFSP